MSFIRQLVVLYFISSCSGLCAEEIHVCGEPAAIDLVTELMYTTGEEVEVSFLIPKVVDRRSGSPWWKQGSIQGLLGITD